MVETKKLCEVEDWKEITHPIHWLITPERRDIAAFLRAQGFCMIDRTLRATVPLKRKEIFSSFCRIPLEECEDAGERIYEIAENSFLLDSRFIPNASSTPDEIRTSVRCRVETMRKFYVCRIKGKIAGFLELGCAGRSVGHQEEISLAAVDEQYRVAGAALSLYAGVAKVCQERGVARLWGRISTRNTAVMNLYVALGATFSLPYDVYARS